MNDQKITQLAQQKTPIKVVQKYYHLDRGVNSYSLKGTNSRGEVYYFIYLPHSQHAYLYSGKRGVSASKVRDSFSQRHAGQKITAVNLGWYEGKPVWEVSAKNAEGNLAFALYDFKNGNELNSVDNL
ncbi:hypothetical protein [Lactobacillus sp. HT06-2]|uniref:hypothetical protein n=1 Tax=Lactobacillus TaxID=1578 RepID=UPI0035126032